MGYAGSIFLIAVGAILTFALNKTVSGINLDTVGIILMIAGAIGLVMFALVWGPRRRGVAAAPADEVVVDRRTTTY
jgi:hypothetical protein